MLSSNILNQTYNLNFNNRWIEETVVATIHTAGADHGFLNVHDVTVESATAEKAAGIW